MRNHAKISWYEIKCVSMSLKELFHGHLNYFNSAVGLAPDGMCQLFKIVTNGNLITDSKRLPARNSTIKDDDYTMRTLQERAKDSLFIVIVTPTWVTIRQLGATKRQLSDEFKN